MVKVTVIVPVYNSEMYIRECMDSLVNQSLTDIEIICIDDGSTDGSLSMLYEYQLRDGRVKVICNETNMGAAESRNRGLSEAAGKYIQFVDADDYLELNTLEDLYQAAEDRKADMCFLGMDPVVPGTGTDMVQAGIKGCYPEIYEGKALMKVLTEKGEFFLYLCLVFYRNRFLKDNALRFRQITIGEGGDFILRALCMTQRVIVCDGKYYHYRINETSVTHSDNAKEELLFGQIIQYIDVLRYFSKQENAEELDCFLADLYRKTAGGIQGLSEKAAKKIENRLETSFEKHIFKMLQQKNDTYGIKFDEEVLSRIQKKNYVVIYGAGYASKEIIEKLHLYGIRIVGFAVTQRKKEQTAVYGHYVYEIGELVSYRKSAVVLVAANKKYNREIRDTLENYGFEDYIFLNIEI